MCGIIGIRAKNEQGKFNFKFLEKAVGSLHHRGPDAAGKVECQKVALGHTRLSIIDVSSAANQPFCDERYALVFNGEIYNYNSLKEVLEESGVRFRTSSDTEVLFEWIKLKGAKGIAALNGCFAFAFYDQKEDYFLLARDRMGIKPCYYFEDENQIIFSSEVKSMLNFEFPKEKDTEAIASFFRLTYFPLNRTYFSKVNKLAPGSFLVSHGGGDLQLSRYFDPKPVRNFDDTYAAGKRRLRELLSVSVERRMVADVSLGTFLSGGVDSTVISALAKSFKKDLKTFSVGFDHPNFDESQYAQIAAKHIGSDHHEIRLTKDSFRENFDDYLLALDQPFADSSSFAMFLLSKYARKHVKVCLSGDGADELLGGYRKHMALDFLGTANYSQRKAISVLSKLSFPLVESRSSKIGNGVRKLRKLATGVSMDSSTRYYEWCTFIPNNLKQFLLVDYMEIGINEFKNSIRLDGFESLDKVLLADQQSVLPNDMLKKVDLMSMANGLEVRTPFLDHTVVELVNSFPANFKIHGKIGKRILKDTFAAELPAEIINRPKAGFEIPIKDWLGNQIMDLLQGEIFTEAYIKSQGIFNWHAIDQIKKNGLNAPAADHIYLIWTLLVFQNWYHNNIA